jgi:hypothetical protein
MLGDSPARGFPLSAFVHGAAGGTIRKPRLESEKTATNELQAACGRRPV